MSKEQYFLPECLWSASSDSFGLFIATFHCTHNADTLDFKSVFSTSKSLTDSPQESQQYWGCPFRSTPERRKKMDLWTQNAELESTVNEVVISDDPFSSFCVS